MSGTFQEYVSYLDTHNAEQKLTPEGGDNNPTNDVVIPTNFTSRYNMAQISLGSLEMPLTQYNVESDWQTLYFDEGIDLYISSSDQETLVQFTISENGIIYTAQLPPRLNPVIDISTFGPTNTAVFTTQFPHQLSLSGFFNWGEPMKLISTPLSDPVYLSVTNLTPSNANLTIISPYQFSLVWGGAAVSFQGNSILGYVSTPSIPSPVYLADLVTEALNEVIPDHWQISYDSCNGKYKVCYIGDTCNLEDLEPAILLVPSTNSLPHIMGFGCADVTLSLPFPTVVNTVTLMPTFNQTANPNPLPNNCVQSIVCSPCRSQIQIDVGSYSPESLMSNLSRQLNRFYFDPGCNFSSNNPVGPVTTSTPITFAYSSSCGLCFTFTIPFGLYNPDLLALYIQTQMASNVSGLSVTWDTDTGLFTFVSSVGDFGLEFDMGSTDLAFKLGFYPISYRNNNTYSSTIPIYYPTKGCCGTSIPTRHLSYVYSPLVNTTQKKFIVEISKTRCINNVGTITNNLDGTITITTQLLGGVNVAHGYQVFDVIEVTIGPGGSTYELVVTAVPAYNQLTVQVGSIFAPIFVGQITCLCLDNSIVSNIYFSCIESDVLCRTLGYIERDALWNVNVPTTWIPPACYSLNWPSYVLVELGEPDGATHNSHAWQTDANHTDVHTRVLGKVLLYPEFRMERSFPYHMIIPDFRVVNRVRIRILNPDHSLYQFHGRNWSFTLVFHAIEKSINQLCI